MMNEIPSEDLTMSARTLTKRYRKKSSWVGVNHQICSGL